MLKHIVTILVFSSISLVLYAQNNDEQLAAQYMLSKEYSKAITLYDALYAKKPSNYIYLNYLTCLLETKDFKQAEKLTRKQIKQSPQMPKYKVDMGYVLLQAGETSKADKQFNQIINDLVADPQQMVVVANAFIERRIFAFAIKTYEKGEKIVGDPTVFNMAIADIYMKMKEYQKMLNEYFELLNESVMQVGVVQSQLQMLLAADNEQKSMQKIIHDGFLKQVQQHPEKTIYSEMLLWLSIQQGDFETALNQAKALDKRLKENGERLIELAKICTENRAYDVASQSYQYVIDKGPQSYNYLTARIEWVKVNYIKVTETNNYTQADLVLIEQQFISTLNEVGKNAESITIMKQLAHLQALYLNKSKEAIDLLNEAMKIAAPELIKADCNLELADILLFSGEMWDASLLYSQVEKDFSEDPIGHLAKFKNAKLTFYDGEFLWAKAQLDVLKASTSKLIANDAMQLALTIGDNIDADSSFDPLSLYAKADLYCFRLKDDSALKTLDLLEQLYPYHPIADEVLFKKAEIYNRQQNWKMADSLLNQVATKFPTDILADDALFERAELNELVIKNLDVAKELYYKIITDYTASIYVAEARKRFRKLRGDILN